MSLESLGESLRRLRKRRGMTQAVLSEESGVCRITICMIECGSVRHMPSFDTLKKLASALDCRVKLTWRCDPADGYESMKCSFFTGGPRAPKAGV
jgi:transcriptional regulator with XRE-family HTH domain